MGSLLQDKSDQTMALYGRTKMPDTIVSMEELLNSPPVTLTIDPDRCQTTIQSVLFRGMSKPLHELLNSPQALNGDMTGVNSVLERDNKGAFMQLLEAAYGTIVKGKGLAAPSTSSKGITKARISTPIDASVLREACTKCNKKKLQLVYACLSCNSSLGKDVDAEIGLNSFLAKQSVQVIDALLAQIPVLVAANTTSPPISLESHDPITSKPYSLPHFARIYTLAKKYEIVAVKFAALKSFYRRLKKVNANLDNIREASITELIDALRFLAESTLPNDYDTPSPIDTAESSDDDVPALSDYITGRVSMTTSGLPSCSTAQRRSPKLLTTLMRYVLVHIDDLLVNEEFREIVTEHGNLGLIIMELRQQSMCEKSALRIPSNTTDTFVNIDS